MDGDGIGGSINPVTKTASDTPTYPITAIGGISAMGGFTPIENARPNANIYGTWGRRLGAGKKLGFIIGGEYDFDGTGYNDLEPTPDEATLSNLSFDPNGNASPNKFSGSYYDLLPSASLRFNAGHDSYMRLIYARGVSRREEQWLAEDVSWGVGGNGAYKDTVAFGSPNFKAETGDDIDVLDVLDDHYFKTFGVLSGGYFYERLASPPVSTQKVLDNYLPPGAPSSDQGTYFARTRPWSMSGAATRQDSFFASERFAVGAGLNFRVSAGGPDLRLIGDDSAALCDRFDLSDLAFTGLTAQCGNHC